MRSILVTGASTGIGWALAEALGGAGHRVYATARRASDLDALSRLPGVTALPLDVRDPDQVHAVGERIGEDGEGLYGLVNNAAVNGLGPLSTYDDAALREIFEVNVFGLHRLTRALLPLLLDGGGRVVNIGSQGGMITKAYFGPYTMTKHALEAYTGALADELEPHGVLVSIVQPGGIVSAMADNSHAGTIARLRSAEPPFDVAAREFLRALEVAGESAPGKPEAEDNRKPSSPDIVVRAVEDALFSGTPRRSYLVGTRWEGNRVVHALLDRLVAANACGTLGYTRDELQAFLDGHLGS